MIRLCLGGTLLLMTTTSWALQTITGKVTMVEPTYMPERITFRMDTGNNTCPAGNWFTWRKDEKNNRAVYAGLLTAMISGKTVNFVLEDNATDCVGSYLHIKHN